ncbi:MAG: type IV secretion protein IcmC [Gammaproteobacteria bacterium]|nr:type IV secretion protein IcmC [Gammaproteobacteria bacterium]
MGEASILTSNFSVMAEIMETISIIIGVFMTFGAIIQFKKYGESRTQMSTQHSAAGPLVMLICGAMLMIIPTVVGTALLAFWGTNSPLAYDGGPAGYNSLIPPILMLVRLVGVGSFIRGIVILSKTGAGQQQPGTIGKGLMHIFAGILCVHIMGTVDLLDSILGLTN